MEFKSGVKVDLIDAQMEGYLVVSSCKPSFFCNKIKKYFYKFRSFGRSKSDTTVPGPFSQTLTDRFEATARNGSGSGASASNGSGPGASASNGSGSGAPVSNGGGSGAPASNVGGSDQTQRKSDSGYFNGYRPFSAGFRSFSSKDAEEKLTSENSSSEKSEKEEKNIFDERKLTLSRYQSEGNYK